MRYVFLNVKIPLNLDLKTKASTKLLQKEKSAWPLNVSYGAVISERRPESVNCELNPTLKAFVILLRFSFSKSDPF